MLPLFVYHWNNNFKVALPGEPFGEQNYFKNGKIDQASLVTFIKDIKKNTNLSDEDAAIIAASKVVRDQFVTNSVARD